MRTSIYLYLFFLLHADRRTGTLYRKLPTIAAEMGINVHTIRKWLVTLRQQGYVRTEFTGRALRIQIQRWKPLKSASRQTSPGEPQEEKPLPLP
jgi:DNA-binding transcriptional regulator YhcF (GntR family)